MSVSRPDPFTPQEIVPGTHWIRSGNCGENISFPCQELSRYLSAIINHHYLMTDEGMEVELHALLALALGGSEWSDSLLDHCTSAERGRGTHWIVG